MSRVAVLLLVGISIGAFLAVLMLPVKDFEFPAEKQPAVCEPHYVG